MKVNEIFLSIQGESLSTGLPTVFVRFSGCNLRCTYCDTAYAYDDGIDMSIKDIIARIHEYGYKRICLTGGEPLLQNEIMNLLKNLSDMEVSIETNGSVDIKDFVLLPNHRFVMDMKTPSSGCDNKMIFENFNFLRTADEIKFVIGSLEDYDWTKNILSSYFKKGMVTISPIFETLDYKEIVDWILRDKLDVRFQLQIHKIIWPPDKRGV